MRLGVLDVGSNTVHLLVVDAHRGAHPTPMTSEKTVLRLAERIGAHGGTLPDVDADELVRTVAEAQDAAVAAGCEELMAFATSAIREADNAGEVLERIRARTGIELEVLPGEDEARFTFLAARRWYGWSAGQLLLLDIGGGYDNSTLQPVFSVIAKNANPEQKEQFLQVIRETLQAQVADGIDQNALLAGINSSEFRFREADFGQFPKGLLYGIQCLDSWLFDDMQPFMHLEALDTYQFLKDQIGTGYYEKLVKTYLLDNPHASVVITVPEQGLGAKRDAALEKKLLFGSAGHRWVASVN